MKKNLVNKKWTEFLKFLNIFFLIFNYNLRINFIFKIMIKNRNFINWVLLFEALYYNINFEID